MFLKAVQLFILLLLSISAQAQLEKSVFYSHQSHYYFDQDRWHEAELYADSAVFTAIRSGIPDSIANAYGWMCEVHLAKKDFQKALTDYKLLISYRDSALGLRQKNEEAQIQELHQKEMSLLKEEVKELKKMAERDQNNAITIFFALLIFLIIIVFIYYRKNSHLTVDLAVAGAELTTQTEFRKKLYSVLSKDVEHSLMSIEESTAELQKNPSLNNDLSLSQMKLHTHHLQISLNHVIQWLGYQTDEKLVSPEELDCKILTAGVLERFQIPLAEKHLTVDMFIPDGQLAYADKAMIEIVLENLISNAVRFTKEGGKITLFSGKKDDLITLGIKDSGIGISETHLHDLFSRIRESRTDGGTESQGSGIGLVLSKDLVERNGGRMYVESLEGRGSTFYFSLPGKKIDRGIQIGE